MKNKLKILVRVSTTLVIIAVIIAIVLKIVNDYKTAQYSKQLNITIENNDIETARKIIEQCPNCVNSLPTIMPYVMRILWDYPVLFYPLQEACNWENYDMVQLLIENGANINCVSRGIESSAPPLTVIVKVHIVWLGENKPMDEADMNIICLLLEKGADKTIKDFEGKTVYDYAVELNDSVLKELLK